MLPRYSAALSLCVVLLAGFGWQADAQQTTNEAAVMRVEEVDAPAGWNVYRGDELIAGYIFDSGGRPIIFPVVGPAGHQMTRGFPIREATEDERSDHDHHRSLWFTHGDVNGVDFWLDDEGSGKIVHRQGTAEIDESGAAVLVTHNDWMSPEGKRILSDVRRVSIADQDGRRIIDYDILLKASDGDVSFGDTKEGSFGIRVAGTMKVEAKNGGTITNAEGDNDAKAWGKKSPWVDYSGLVDGDRVGITIHDHPSSFGYPCRWHVRTYGLFAANPFGFHHFTGGDKHNGIVLKEGSEMRLNYRIVLYTGKFDADVAAKDSKQFANDPRPIVE